MGVEPKWAHLSDSVERGGPRERALLRARCSLRTAMLISSPSWAESNEAFVAGRSGGGLHLWLVVCTHSSRDSVEML